MKQTVYNLKKKKLSEIELSDAVFGQKVNRKFLHEMLLIYRENKRQGTSNTLTRKDVTGSTRKIYRQKGTGQARHGDIKAPIFVGGGTVFGPHPRDWRSRLPVKMRRKALCEALALKVKQGQLMVVDQFKMDKPKTKVAHQILKDLGLSNVLIVMDKPSVETVRSVRNLPHCRVSRVADLNAYDVIGYNNLLLTTESVEKVQQWLQA